MSELLKKQNYGVEVEFIGITRAMAAKAAGQSLNDYVVTAIYQRMEREGV